MKKELKIIKGDAKVVLFVSWHSTFPRNNGANVRIASILRNFKDFYPIFLSPEPKDDELSHITFKPFHIPEFINKFVPFNLEIFGCVGSKVKRQAIESLAKYNIECIVCEHLWSYPLAHKLSIELQVPLILVEHVIETLYAFRSFRSRIIAKLTSFYERHILKKSDRVIVVSNYDKKYLKENFDVSEEKCWVVPNGVTLPEQQTDRNEDSNMNIFNGFKIVLFLGKTTLVPNATAISIIENKILPKVRSKNKNVVFVIVGGPTTENFDRINEGFVRTGFVPSVFPYIKRADLCIAPLVGHSGMPLKVLEYASFKKPIVATSIAVEGAEFKNDEDIIISDDWEGFAQAILNLIEDSDKANKLGKAAFDRIKENYQWHSITNDFEKQLINLIN